MAKSVAKQIDEILLSLKPYLVEENVFNESEYLFDELKSLTHRVHLATIHALRTKDELLMRTLIDN